MATQSSALTKAFTEEFDEGVIKKVDGFDNVAPHHYRQRLVDNLPFEYDVFVDAPVLLGKSVVSVKTAIVLPNGKRSEANGTSTLTNKDGEITSESVMYAVREAQSTGLKLALTNYGMGLHLYFGHDDEQRPSRAAQKAAKAKPAPEPEEDEEEEAPPPRRSTKSSSNGKSNDWSSKREKFTYPNGKNKDKKYCDLEDSFLRWANENLDPEHEKYGEMNAKILKCVNDEIKYRKDNDTWNPDAGRKKSNKPTTKRRIDEADSEDDF